MELKENDKVILVTGGAGYIGSHVVKKLGEKQQKLVIFDNLSTGNEKAILYGDFVKGDLSDLEKLEYVFKTYNIEAVMHFAGSIVVPESVSNPLKYYQNNTMNSLSLIQMCLKYNVDKFIFSSTAAVYGIQNGLVDESTEVAPINPYGCSKLMTEQMLQDASMAHKNFNFIALRYFNVAGADIEGKIGQAFPGATHLIKVNAEAATGKREKIFVYGKDFNTPDKSAIRDYIHVEDLAQAHLCSLDFLKINKKSEVFNCGYGKGHSVLDVIKTVKKVSGVNYEVIETERRPGDPESIVADSKKIKNLTSWEPKYNNLEIIVKSALDWEASDTLKTWR